jgi:hypothetical protein
VVAAWIYFGGLCINSPWSWRIPTLFQLAGPIIVNILLFDIPESPGFLLHRDKEEETLQILATHHANGQTDDELVLHDRREIKASRAAEELNKQTYYLDFLRNNRRPLFVICVISFGPDWVGNRVVS